MTKRDDSECFMFLIFIFPLMIFVLHMVIFLLLKVRRGVTLTKELLILLAHIKPWSMPDIFFISILVALVKLVAFGQIYIGVAFWELMVVMIDVFITKRIRLFELWMLRKRIFVGNETL